MVTEPSTMTAPYAPVDNVLKVIRRLRERGLPSPLTLLELERLGIPSGNAPRTLAALRFLGLIEEDGQRSETFDRLGKANTDEYAGLLAEIVRAAYSPVFTIVDPARDGDIAINDAFRQYTPEAQRPRMVTLFLGLCREAGLIPGGSPVRHARLRKATPKPKSRLSSQKGEEIEVEGKTVKGEIAGVAGSPDYRVLAALIQQLPRDKKWTSTMRNKWVHAVEAAVDFQIEVTEETDLNIAKKE